MWSEQIFDQVATISAIDDTLFELDEGLKRGVVDLKPFLRSVRNLASQQFRAKALAMKICELQSQMMLARHSSKEVVVGAGGKTNYGSFLSNNGQSAYTGYGEVSACTSSYECCVYSVSKKPHRHARQAMVVKVS